MPDQFQAPLAGDEATFAAVAQVMREIKVGSVDPQLVDLARRLASLVGSSSPDPLALGIRNWLVSVWRYVDDPLEAEYIRPAADSLAQWQGSGFIYGDCDDLSVFGGAIARSLGFHVSLTVLAFADSPWVFSHIYATVLTPAGTDVSLDVLKPAPGLVPPIARQRTFTL